MLNLQTHNPELVKEWHLGKNGDLKPCEVTPSSHKKVWWICNKGHEWLEEIKYRNSGYGDCMICKSLKTINPDLAREWHPTKNDLLPYAVLPNSHKKVWWIASCGHEWLASIKDRHLQKANCPYCFGNWTIKEDNCLSFTNPEILSEWHSKNRIMPHEVRPNSNIKVWWICNKGHEWKARISNRISCKSGCPICNESKGEKEVVTVLNELKIPFERQVSFSDCRYKLPLRFDFKIEYKKVIILIEFQGKQHYEGWFNNPDFKIVKTRDNIKKNYCVKNKLNLLEIPYWEMSNMHKIIKEYIGKFN